MRNARVRRAAPSAGRGTRRDRDGSIGTMNAIVEQILAGEKRQTGSADMMLEAAGWAANSFAGFDRSSVEAICRAAAEAGFAAAGKLAEDAVRETGFGVAEHKKIKNE